MDTNEIDKVKIELDKIYKEFKDFQSTVNTLVSLQENDPTVSTLTRGALTSAGANAEIILKYIAKKENITVTSKPGRDKTDSPNKPPMLNDYIYILAQHKILPPEVENHLRTIQNWRNHSSHGNYLDKIGDSTVESISASMKHIVKWFFEEYLKYANVDYSFKKAPKKHTNESEVNINKQENKSENTTSNSDNKFVKSQKQRSRLIRILLALVFFGLIYFGYNFYAEASTPEDPTLKKELSKEEAYDLIIKYYNSSIDKNADAHDFFANRVEQFYNCKNVNPTQVDIIKRTEVDYIDRKNAIDKSSIKLYLKTDSVTYWRFWNDFVCYRTTKHRFQTCRVFTEFGFNNDGKITSIKEIDVQNIKYSKKKPL